jgi:putative ABC transport system permease protein
MTQDSGQAASDFKWLLIMAWRDSRKNWSRLLLFISSIILGIAALVAINSFSYNLRNDIDAQAKTLLGADLVISDNRPISAEMQALLDSIPGKRSRENSFASMVYFLKSDQTRLAQIRALEGDFPYYGAIETTPAQAATTFRQGGRKALVDQTLMLQFNAEVGDSIKVGELTFEIAGRLEQVPGQAGIAATVAPAIYIPMNYLEETGLIQKGSRVIYRYYYQIENEATVNKIIKATEPRFEKEGFDIDTVETRKEGVGRTFDNLTGFLNLVAFIALLLGCVGVASAVQVYIKEKIPSVAVLRCLGLKGYQAFLIYLVQIAALGLLGATAGAIIGTLIQFVLPQVLADFLPLELSLSISWKAIAQGIVTGLVISVLFALFPLLSIRNISPLNTLRVVHEDKPSRDPLRWLVYALIIVFVFVFAWLQINNLKQAFFFTLGLIAAFLVLAGVAKAIIWLVRRYFPVSWSYLWRQSLANLFRPGNQTQILIVSIGLGTALIAMLYFVQNLLIEQVNISDTGKQPNMVLFDIQTSQREEIAALTRSYQLPVIQQVPIVTMRLEEINGNSAEYYREDSTRGVPNWAFTREYRVTYRDSLIDSEKLTAGTWYGNVASPEDTVYISLEEGYAERMHINLGDKLLFNVQGALVPTVVGSLREVEWNRVQSNFLVVFPAGVLEAAPQFHVLMTRVNSNEASARFQQALVKQFPTISVVDLALIISTLDDILSKVSFVIRFMALFSIVTGMLVLVASVLISKYQRVQESVLLRTIGASRRQILIINALEYFFLGSLAALTGIILSLAGSWALAYFSFESTFLPDLLPMVITYLLITGLTVVIGMLNSRSVLNKPPLEVLRSEVA